MVIRFEANVSNNYVRDKTEFYGENLMVRGMYVFLKIFFFFFCGTWLVSNNRDYKINLFYV